MDLKVGDEIIISIGTSTDKWYPRDVLILYKLDNTNYYFKNKTRGFKFYMTIPYFNTYINSNQLKNKYEINRAIVKKIKYFIK